jgi:hypothetical protein
MQAGFSFPNKKLKGQRRHMNSFNWTAAGGCGDRLSKAASEVFERSVRSMKCFSGSQLCATWQLLNVTNFLTAELS